MIVVNFFVDTFGTGSLEALNHNPKVSLLGFSEYLCM